ncbi:nuclear transport factor 2 family protein [Marinobacterium weihaiense]|uniref:Nuclear transport factor 2 family protein n=1 Tax=Marinobacterium weihaiense TaxID=2851016 RepID=A0ABS6MFX2_9GAMM|nr:nuclear transport factor 2 family protein [Marinobacterium weihaiense]MBV0934706.1 nuclear transport factor 2 family protein [Marinobacterium weihaiense]
MNSERRLARLEALEAIRQLKHRYLNACDTKDVVRIRDCFAPGAISIDYGPIGTFDNRDRFIDLYRQLACHERVKDLHHAGNPEIELTDDHNATARWALFYFNLDADTGATLQLSGQYHDCYRCIEGEWKIVATRFERLMELAQSTVQDAAGR